MINVTAIALQDMYIPREHAEAARAAILRQYPEFAKAGCRLSDALTNLDFLVEEVSDGWRLVACDRDVLAGLQEDFLLLAPYLRTGGWSRITSGDAADLPWRWVFRNGKMFEQHCELLWDVTHEVEIVAK